MKLSEYEIFHHQIKESMGLSNGLEVLAVDCFSKLSLESIKEIENLMIRKLAIWNLKHNRQNNIKQQLLA
jgi:hypothetical protein